MSMLRLRRQSGEKGQGLSEYALILVLVAVVVILILSVLGPDIAGVLAQVNAVLNGGLAVVSAEVTSAGAFNELHVTVVTSEQTTVTLTTSEGPSGSASCQPREECVVTASGVTSGSYTVSTPSAPQSSGTY